MRVELAGIRIGNRERCGAAGVVGVERAAAGRAVRIARIAGGRARQRSAAAGRRIDAGRRQRRAVAITGDELKRRRDRQPIVLVVQQQRRDVRKVERVHARADGPGKIENGRYAADGIEERECRREPVRVGDVAGFARSDPGRRSGV